MAWVRFIAKIVISILSPLLLAFVSLRVWSALQPAVVIYENETWTDQAFGLLTLGLILLSVALPILFTIREIQNNSVRGRHSISSVTEPSTNSLWK